MELMQRRRELMTFEHGHWATATGGIATFNTPFAKPLRSLKAEFMPVQEGTGDPSPDNVRPISGRTGIEVMRSPKNIFPKSLPEQLVKGNWSTGSTSISAATNSRCFSIYIGTNRTLKFTKTGVLTMQLAFTDSPILDRSNTLYGAVNCTNRATYTLNSNEHPYLGISIASVSAWDTLEERECILRFNETPEGFEARVDWEPIPIDWTDSAGTIYGGYVDLVTGEVWETHHKIILDGVTTNCKVNRDYSDSTHIVGGIVYLTPNGAADGQYSTNLLCDNMPILAPSAVLPENYPYIRTISSGSQYLRIYVGATTDHSDLDTSEKRIAFVNEYLAEHSATVVYPLATPILVTTLTPTELRTLVGTNNIWSTANGNVTAEYWTR